MEISVSEAKGQLTDLVRRAENGDDVLTRHGQPTVRLVPVAPIQDRSSRRRILDAVRKSGATIAVRGGDAARSQDFLYDEDGLPK